MESNNQLHSAGVEHHRAIVIGAGFAGIAASIELAKRGIDHIVLERAQELGGTWRDNTYPGCRCDVPTALYSLSSAPSANWSETYASQKEIQSYLRHTAREHGVVDRVRFGQEMTSARWEPERKRWRVTTDTAQYLAELLLVATGPLSQPSMPELPGMSGFRGQIIHSARWPTELSLRGQRVGVIGTGASAIQLVPELQRSAERLVVFQRTPPWILPHPNRAIPLLQRRLYNAAPGLLRMSRAFAYWGRELFAWDFFNPIRGVAVMETLARRHLARQVRDPKLRAQLTPSYRAGCKRILLSNDYYPAVTQPNVELVTSPIEGLSAMGVRTADGRDRPLDSIVFATGFSVAEPLVGRRLFGRTGRSLSDYWSESGTQAYLGACVPEFPNLFLLAGPNTGSGHTSLLFMIESQLKYVLGAIRCMDSTGASAIEVKRQAFERWTQMVQTRSQRTVWMMGGCRSWYLDPKGRNVTLWPDFTFRIRRLARFERMDHDLVT